jgi:hypothetical protein
MVNLVSLLLLAMLATYRLSRLIADETGPWRLFERLREATPEGSNLRDGVQCIMCVSVWAAALVTWWLWWHGTVQTWLLPVVWLALSAGTVLLRKWEAKR